MSDSQKKRLQNGGNAPKINPDAYWHCVKREAKEKGYGTIVVEFTIHNGEVRGAELGCVIAVGDRRKLSPY